MNLAQIELNSEQKFHFVTLCGGVFLPCVVIKMSCSLMLSADSIKGKKRQERNPLVHIQCMVSLNTKKSAILGKSHDSFFIPYSIYYIVVFIKRGSIYQLSYMALFFHFQPLCSGWRACQKFACSRLTRTPKGRIKLSERTHNTVKS